MHVKYAVPRSKNKVLVSEGSKFVSLFTKFNGLICKAVVVFSLL